MESWIVPCTAPAVLPRALEPATAPAYYVPVPRRLAEDLRDAPAAVGAFALLARVFRATRQPVPLSPGDLQGYDPALSYGAATRALQRLAGAGWLVPERRPGRKTLYTPSWGHIHGAARPWDLKAPCLGRPRHIGALRLDQRLLDVCMGRLDPHPTHPALVRRYLAAPLLGLREIGSYALALAGLRETSRALEQLGLLEDGRPLPVPDEATILAVASQRDDRALSPEGWRRTPFGAELAPAAPAESGQALFFVPPDQIGPMIGGVIAGSITISTASEPRSTPSESPITPMLDAPAGSHGEKLDGDNSTTSTAIHKPALAGGGDLSLGPTLDTHPATPSAPAPGINETARALQSIGIRRSVAASLSNRPAALVARIIAQARARRDVRDLAGWVVSALRDLPDAEEAPPERPLSALPIHTHPGLSDEQRDRWIWRFRAAQTPSEQRAILDRLAQEHPV